jgi:uncharacterized protein (TIGR03435 family)
VDLDQRKRRVLRLHIDEKEDNKVNRQCLLSVSLLLLVWRASAQKPSFEVVSIKPNMSGKDGGSMGPRGDEFFGTNITLRNLLVYAYSPPNGQLLRPQIIGGPDWTNTDHFDLQAKSGGNARVLPGEQTKTMLQSLLEDRFQLKAHRETRDLPVYNLVVVKSGPKLSADQTPPDARQAFIMFGAPGESVDPLPRGAMRMITGPSSTTITGIAIPISKVITLLQGRSDRIVIDKTSFNGLLDVHLEFSQDLGTASPDAANPASPSLFAAIQDLGLKLESAKAPLEVLVIDSVQKPSEN